MELFIQHLLTAGGAIGLFLAAAVLCRSRNLSAFLFAFTALLFSIDISCALYEQSRYYREFPALLGISRALPFLYGPSVYLLAAAVTSQIRRLSLINMLHAVPFILYCCLLIPFFAKDPATRIFLFEHYIPHTSEIELFPHIFFALKLFSYIIYIGFAAHLIVKYERLVEAFYAEPEKQDMKWIKILLAISAVSTVCYIWALGWQWVMPLFVPIKPPMLFYGFEALWLFTAGIFIVKYSHLFDISIDIDAILAAEQEPEEKQADNRIAEKEKYVKAKLDRGVMEEYRDQLTQYMNSEKPFKDPLITLPVLAKKLGIQPHHLSMVINTCLNQNFYAFINTYRINYACVLLKTPKTGEENILEIAYSAGFNSKSAFNTAFRRITGKTPSEYRK